MILALPLTVQICTRFINPKGTLRSLRRTYLFYRFIHSFTIQYILIEQIALDQKNGRVTCLRLRTIKQNPASHNLKTFGTFLYLPSTKSWTSAQSLRSFRFAFPTCVQVSETAARPPLFPAAFCARLQRKFILQHATFLIWQTVIYFLIDVPGRHTPNLLEWWHS